MCLQSTQHIPGLRRSRLMPPACRSISAVVAASLPKSALLIFRAVVMQMEGELYHSQPHRTRTVKVGSCPWSIHTLLPSYTSSSIRHMSACQCNANIACFTVCKLTLSASVKPSKKRSSKRGTGTVYTPLKRGFCTGTGAHPVHCDELTATKAHIIVYDTLALAPVVNELIGLQAFR